LITGTSITRAVGASSGLYASGGNGTAGTTNYGNGGSGAQNGFTGGAGGSGVVILKIPNNYSSAFSGGVTFSTGTTAGFNIFTVTAAGVSDTVTFS
jgi:hypothetical protein